MTVTVEIAAKADDTLLEGLNRLLPQLSTTAAPLTRRTLEELVGSDAVTLFIASIDGEIVGTLTLVVFSIPSGRRAWIEDVVVDAHARGLGVGQVLTTAATDEAARLGVRSIDLTSRPSREAANAMYQKLGFEARAIGIVGLT